MFFEEAIVGDRLPRGTLCLTFDDGPGRSRGGDDDPGPKTAELGAFLAAEGVPAAFFAVGKFAREGGDILARLRALGHLVANHTYDHPSLPAYVARGGDAADQLILTDLHIRDHVEGPVTYFRPPYGDWRLTGAARSNVAAALNASARLTRHVGPIGWDIDAGDVGFWRDGRLAGECAHAYLEAIERAGRGIVLMHDSTADIDAIRPRNRALGLARVLVPELKRRGYRFVRLDAVAQVASAARVASLCRLVALDGLFLSVPRSGGEVAFVAGEAQASVLGVVPLGGDRCALRGPGGLFLTPGPDGAVVAEALSPGGRETLLIEPRGSGTIALRTPDGRYLSRGRDSADSRLRSDAHSAGAAETFRREGGES